jgi:putative ABC transport system ATP-binding protein
VRLAVGLAALALVVTALANYWMNVRLYRTTENGLSALRTRAFRRRARPVGAAPGRRAARLAGLPRHQRRRHVSTFMQWGGLLVLVSSAQLLLATCSCSCGRGSSRWS